MPEDDARLLPLSSDSEGAPGHDTGSGSARARAGPLTLCVVITPQHIPNKDERSKFFLLLSPSCVLVALCMLEGHFWPHFCASLTDEG